MLRILITGSTGTIGSAVLAAFERVDVQLILLVRHPQKILAQLNGTTTALKNSIQVIQGDLSLDRLGLSDTDYQLALTANVIIHAGGPMDIQLDEQTAQAVFAKGTQSIITLAQAIHLKSGLKHFIHVVGYMSPFDETSAALEPNAWQMTEFMTDGNAYERYKFLADLYVRQQAKRLNFPLSVVNPSTIVGGDPTGETKQLGGLGQLVKLQRQKRLPFIPGGKKYWLPLVSNVVLAQAIVHLAQNNTPINQTYTFTPHQAASPSMVNLTQRIARELQITPPKLILPIPVLSTLLKLGIGKWFKIPSEPLAFISKKSFDNTSAMRLIQELGRSSLDMSPLLPHVIADLDYRLTFSDSQALVPFTRQVAKHTIYFKKSGVGTPWVIIHGLFSDAVDFSQLALEIHTKTGNPVYVIDLPGIGHSPIKNNHPIFDDYVQSILSVIEVLGQPVNLLGHSFGANLAAKVATTRMDLIRQLVLLQPLTQKTAPNWLLEKLLQYPKFVKIILRHFSINHTQRYLLKHGSFTKNDTQTLKVYSQRMYDSLSSPRILATNANLMGLISHQSAQIDWTLLPAKTAIFWGEKDTVYQSPRQTTFPIHYFDFGHQFPISNPQTIAAAIQKL